MRRALVSIAIAVVTVTGGSACRSASRDDASRRTPPPAPPKAACTEQELARGRSRATPTVDGVERSYLAFRPATGDGPLPLVINLHGYGSSATQQLIYTAIEPVAEREGFLVVAPDGAGTPPRFELFDGRDVDFITAIIDELVTAGCVAADRVYAMGMSNGGAMSAVLACRAGDRFAAIAPVAAVVYGEVCDDAPPVPIAAFMGTADPVVPFDGGRVNCCGNPTIASAPAAMESWAAHNGCDSAATVQRIAPDIERRTWPGCDEGADTTFYVIEGGGHTWPGALPIARLGKTTASIEATDAIWAFFAAHPAS